MHLSVCFAERIKRYQVMAKTKKEEKERETGKRMRKKGFVKALLDLPHIK